MTSAGRPDAPVLLVTKLHPPFVPAQTIARERLFERLRDGRGLKLSLVACPAGFGKSTLLAAWREREARRAARRVGDAGRGRQRRGRAVVARDRGARPRLPGARGRGARPSWSPPRRCSRWCCRGSSTSSPSRARSCSSSTTSTGSRAPRRARASRGSSTTCPRRSSSCSRRAPTRRCRSARCAPTGSCWSCARTTCASRRPRRTSSSTAASGSSWPPPTSTCSSRGPRAGPPASTWRRCRWRASRTSAGLVRAFDGTSAHVVDFLSSEVLGAYEPELQAFMLRTSVLERLCAPLCDAVLGGDGVGRRAGVARALEPLPAAARRPAPLVPLPPPLRPAPARRARAARARARRRACTGARSSGTTSSARPTRRSTTPSRRTRSPRPGALIAETWVHYVNAGRTSSVLDWLLRFPEETLDADARLLLVKAWVSALRGREDDMRGALARAAARSAGWSEGPLPDGFASLESSLCRAERGVRVGRRGGDPRGTARGRPSSRARSRRGARWSRGRSAGATTATASSTSPSAGCARRRRSPRAPTSGSSAPARSPTSRSSRACAAAAPSSCAWRPRRSSWRASTGCSRRARSARCTRPTASRWPRTGRREEALPALEQGVFLRRLWGQPLDLVDGLIALAAATRRRRRPRARGGALPRGGGDPGRLPRPGRAARPPRRREARAALAAAGDGELSERELEVLRAAERRAVRARDRPGALPLLQHRPQPREVRLPQARGRLAGATADRHFT